MEMLPLMRDLALVWMTALLFGWACVRSGQPTVAGYILAGFALGPHGAGLISQEEQIKVLAEFGVALLLFWLGVDIKLRRVFSCGRRAIAAAAGQIVLTVGVAAAVAYLCGLSPGPRQALVFGLICALSSTAVVTKVLADRGEVDALYGRLLIAVLLIQDLSLVPFVSIMPALGEQGSALLPALALSLVKSLLLVALIMWSATKVVPHLLGRVAEASSRELFLLALISLCLGVALGGQQFGLSLALGAFLAGIMVSEGPYGHQALADLSPLKDLFSVLFFVSVGMLFDPAYVASHWVEVLCFAALLVSGKGLIAAVSARIATSHLVTCLSVGAGLANMGEFSFVLASIANRSGMLSEGAYNLFLAGAVFSLILAPALMAVTPKLVQLLSRRSFESSLHEAEDKDGGSDLSGHVILLGFGRVGRNLGTVLESHEIPYLVVEMNAAIVADLDARGIPSIWGDALSGIVLSRAGVERAAVIVVTVPDPITAVAVIRFTRRANPHIPVIVRGHRTEDIEIFRSAGANAVVQPEFESSAEITRLVLMSLKRTHPEIRAALNHLRKQRYQIFKPDISEPLPKDLHPFQLEEPAVAWFVVEGAYAAGKTLEDLQIRKRTGATVLAIKSGDDVFPHPGPHATVARGDELYVVGSPAALAAFEKEFQAPRFCPISEATTSDIP